MYENYFPWINGHHQQFTQSPLPQRKFRPIVVQQGLLGYRFLLSDGKGEQTSCSTILSTFERKQISSKVWGLLTDSRRLHNLSVLFSLLLLLPPISPPKLAVISNNNTRPSVELTAIFKLTYLLLARHHSTLDRLFFPSFNTIFF